MKSKFQRKHLSLNKVTVAHLNPLEMRIAKGGCILATIDCSQDANKPCQDTEKLSINTCSA